jgi:hypothetical protein
MDIHLMGYLGHNMRIDVVLIICFIYSSISYSIYGDIFYSASIFIFLMMLYFLVIKITAFFINRK